MSRSSLHTNIIQVILQDRETIVSNFHKRYYGEVEKTASLQPMLENP